MNYSVYIIKCLKNNKIYFGWTKLTLEKRFKRHCVCDKKTCYLQNCIKKYGPSSFTIELIESFTTSEEAKQKETLLIKEFKTNICQFPMGIGMNMSDGGEGLVGYKPSEEQKRKLSLSLKGKPKTAAHCENIRKSKKGQNNPMFGRSQTLKSRAAAKQRFTENNPRKNPKYNISVYRIDKENISKEYSTITVAAKENKTNSFKIFEVCLGNRRQAANYYWKFKQKPN